MLLQKSKKSDVHLHLSSAVHPSVLWDLIKDLGLKTPAKNYAAFEKSLVGAASDSESLDDYLELLHRVDKVQSSPNAVELCAYRAFVDSFLYGGAEHVELRFNPVKRSQKGVIDLDAIILAAWRAFERASANYGITGGLIFCLGRDCTEAENRAIFAKALKYHAEKKCLGIDLAGSESIPLAPYFEEMYSQASFKGLLTTIHCAETPHDRHDELAKIVFDIRPDRVGHGIYFANYPEILDWLAGNETELEVCPTSNLATKAVRSKGELRRIFETFDRAGVRYSINTDATHLLNTNLSRELELYHEIMSFPAG